MNPNDVPPIPPRVNSDVPDTPHVGQFEAVAPPRPRRWLTLLMGAFLLLSAAGAVTFIYLALRHPGSALPTLATPGGMSKIARTNAQLAHIDSTDIGDARSAAAPVIHTPLVHPLETVTRKLDDLSQAQDSVLQHLNAVDQDVKALSDKLDQLQTLAAGIDDRLVVKSVKPATIHTPRAPKPVAKAPVDTDSFEILGMDSWDSTPSLSVKEGTHQRFLRPGDRIGDSTLTSVDLDRGIAHFETPKGGVDREVLR